MTISNIGFNGQVADTDWARLGRMLGESPCIERVGDLPISQVANARQVILGLGAGGRSGVYADGVITSINANETLPVLQPNNGQWYLLVATRDWSARTTTLQYRNGPVTAVGAAGAPPTAVPSTFPASSVSNPGVQSDLAIAWVWSTSVSTTLSIVPLLNAPNGVYPQKGTAAQRDAYFATSAPINAGVAGQLKFGEVSDLWFNTDTQCVERYIAAYDATVNPLGVRTAQWFWVEGLTPYLKAKSNGSDYWSVSAGSQRVLVIGSIIEQQNIAFDIRYFTFPKDGLYRIRGAVGMTGGGTQWVQVYLNVDGANTDKVAGTRAQSATTNLPFDFDFIATAGQKGSINTRSQVTGISIVNDDAGAVITWLIVEYVGPA